VTFVTASAFPLLQKELLTMMAARIWIWKRLWLDLTHPWFHHLTSLALLQLVSLALRELCLMIIVPHPETLASLVCSFIPCDLAKLSQALGLDFHFLKQSFSTKTLVVLHKTCKCTISSNRTSKFLAKDPQRNGEHHYSDCKRVIRYSTNPKSEGLLLQVDSYLGK
jgi:hypothetical protein